MVLSRFRVQLGRALRETGQALDRAGLRAAGENFYQEKFSRHRQIMNILDKRPGVVHDAWVAPNATVIGDVLIGHNSSVWYNVVIRGDENSVEIAHFTNVQDNTVVGTARSSETGFPTSTKIGSYVTIGHSCTLMSCVIQDHVIIGMGSVIMDGAFIERGAQIAAGSVVLPGQRIPAFQLWGGNPASFMRELDPDDEPTVEQQATDYQGLAKIHADEFLPFGTAYLDVERIKSEGGSL